MLHQPDQFAGVFKFLVFRYYVTEFTCILQESRDPFRTPMLWSTGDNAGFCAKNVTPWLPVNADYMSNNVEVNVLPYKCLFSSKKNLLRAD